MTERSLDLVLFGATGFTGRLVADYLAARPDTSLRWALAGRSLGKLTELRTELAEKHPAVKDLELVVVDASDAPTLASVARRTRVVCTTVGPYARYGAPLVAACVEAGTDYCDLTGEVAFMRAMIDKHHVRAGETGARIVHSCGFDSIPSDLGVLALHERVKNDGGRLTRAHLLMKMRGGFSGGTASSMVDSFAAARRDPAYRRLMADPYALNPDLVRDRGPEKRDQPRIAYSHEDNVWTAPFIMAAVNTRVVRRSNALLEWPYGRGFIYDEVMFTGRGPVGLATAMGVTAGLGVFAGLILSELTRPMMVRMLPAAGEGPSKAQRTAGFFKARIFGAVEGQMRPKYVCTVDGRGDPGYSATARMLSEAALQLSATFETERKGGVLTPASALGLPLLERLAATDIRCSVTTC